MSTERIVNRVAQPFLESEGEKLNLVPNETLEVLENTLPLVEDVLDSPAVQMEMEAQQLEVNTDLLSQFRALVGSSDQKVFRDQVIRAFKHLGLDTKKFFGE